MTWEHSYTPEAYADARRALEKWPRSELLKAIACDNYQQAETDRRHKGPRTAATAERALRFASDENLADAVMENVERLRLCSNGGHEMYACAYGCCTVVLADGEEDDDA